MELSGKDKRKLRALANPLKAAIKIGKEGISENSIKAISELLDAKELIKIDVTRNAPVDAKEAADIIIKETASQLVGIIGRKVIIFKRNDEEPKIEV